MTTNSEHNSMASMLDKDKSKDKNKDKNSTPAELDTNSDVKKKY